MFSKHLGLGSVNLVKCRSLLRSPLRNVRLRLGARLDPSRVGYGYLKPHEGAALPASVGVGCTEPYCGPKVFWVAGSRARLCAAGNLVRWTAYVREAVELSR